MPIDEKEKYPRKELSFGVLLVRPSTPKSRWTSDHARICLMRVLVASCTFMVDLCGVMLLCTE